MCRAFAAVMKQTAENLSPVNADGVGGAYEDGMEDDAMPTTLVGDEVDLGIMFKNAVCGADYRYGRTRGLRYANLRIGPQTFPTESANPLIKRPLPGNRMFQLLLRGSITEIVI